MTATELLEAQAEYNRRVRARLDAIPIARRPYGDGFQDVRLPDGTIARKAKPLTTKETPCP